MRTIALFTGGGERCRAGFVVASFELCSVRVCSSLVPTEEALASLDGEANALTLLHQFEGLGLLVVEGFQIVHLALSKLTHFLLLHFASLLVYNRLKSD